MTTPPHDDWNTTAVSVWLLHYIRNNQKSTASPCFIYIPSGGFIPPPALDYMHPSWQWFFYTHSMGCLPKHLSSRSQTVQTTTFRHSLRAIMEMVLAGDLLQTPLRYSALRLPNLRPAHDPSHSPATNFHLSVDDFLDKSLRQAGERMPTRGHARMHICTQECIDRQTTENIMPLAQSAGRALGRDIIIPKVPSHQWPMCRIHTVHYVE